MERTFLSDVNLASISKPRGMLRRRSSNESNLAFLGNVSPVILNRKELPGLYSSKTKEVYRSLSKFQNVERFSIRYRRRIQRAILTGFYIVIFLLVVRFLIKLRCRNLCQWPADEITGDYFSPSAETYQRDQLHENKPFQHDFRNFLSKSIYRDMSDIIIHTDEFPEGIDEADSAMYRYTFRKQFYLLSKLFWSPCLSPIPIFYFFNDEYDVSKQNLQRFLSIINTHLYFNQPFMIISVSFPILPYTKHPELLPILNHPNCLKWFTTNIVEHHEKIIAIPLGILMESHLKQAPLLAQVLSENKEKQDLSLETNENHPNLVLVNFSTDNPIKVEYRKAPHNHFCHPDSEFQKKGKIVCTKTGGFFDESFKRNEEELPWETTALDTYRLWSQFKYTVCPRGEKLDSYRIWESLYLGSVPIIQHSTNDVSVTNLFGFSDTELPVLFVTDFEQVTVGLLEYLWENRFRKMMEDGKWRDNLSAKRLKETIKYVREEEMKKWYFPSNKVRRARCWGGTQGRW